MTPRADRLRRLLALLAILALAGFAAACGDDDEGGDSGDTTVQTEPAPPPTDETEAADPDTEPADTPTADAKDPESAFLSFQTALADGDADAVCGSLTPTAIKQVEEASIGGKCDTWVEELSNVYDPGSEAKLRKTKVDDVVEKGDKATVKYTSPILNLPLEAELEKDGDVWKISKLAEAV